MPRERFVPEHVKELGLEGIYKDVALPTKKDEHGLPISSSSQPGIMAPMLEELRLESGMNVLEIGAGTGYNAALISKLIGSKGHLTTLDIEKDIVDRARRAIGKERGRVSVVLADGREGWKKGSPYDRVIATASAFEVPLVWADQLVDGGLLVVPLVFSDRITWPQAVVTFKKEGSALRSISIVPGGFMRMRSSGEAYPEEGAIYVGSWIKGKSEQIMIQSLSVDRLALETRRRLLYALAAVPQQLAIDGSPSTYSMAIFMTLFADPSQHVALKQGRYSSPALIDSEGDWVTALMRGRTRSGSVEVFGDMALATKAWKALDSDWKRQGRPNHKDLVISVTKKRPTEAWRIRKIRNGWMTFDWNGAKSRS